MLATASAPLTMAHPHDGWAEQDPADWERRARGLRCARRGEQAGVAPAPTSGCSGSPARSTGWSRSTTVCAPLRPAIIWLDRRAGRQTDALAAAAGAERAHRAHRACRRTPRTPRRRRCGCATRSPSTTAPRAGSRPVGGHLTGWLTGEVVQDHANASSTLLYDVHDPRLERRARRARRPRRGQAAADPRLARGRRDAATARRRRRWGCRRRCRGHRRHRRRARRRRSAPARSGPGSIVDVTGTAEPVAVPADEAVVDDERLVETHAHAVPTACLLVENPGFVSGGSTRWLAETQRISAGRGLRRSPPEAPPGADGVLFLPALSGSMAPRWNDRMRGAFAGLAMNHGGEHLARAVLEGCTFALRDIVDRFGALGLGGDEIRVVGGGARSPLWLQIKADVTGLPRATGRGRRRDERRRRDARRRRGGQLRRPRGRGRGHRAPRRTSRCCPTPRPPSSTTRPTRRYRRLFDATEQALA